MIGMATVANPELEGIKNESGMKSRKRMSTKRAPDVSATRPSRPVEHRVGDLPVVHDHGDAAGDADDECHPEQVARPVDERAGQVRLGESADDADQDGEEEERGGHLREPPPERGNRDPEVLPGDDAVDHDHEGQEEEPEHDLVAPGEGSELRSGLLAGQEARLVLRLLRVDERLRRIGA